LEEIANPQAMKRDPAEARYCVYCRWFVVMEMCDACLEESIRERPYWTPKKGKKDD
jgi:hypothetical protein